MATLADVRVADLCLAELGLYLLRDRELDAIITVLGVEPKALDSGGPLDAL
jgi:hypothetical protein